MRGGPVMSTWRDRPNEIPDHEIAETVTGDVVVVGLGYSGAAAVRAAAEAGALCASLSFPNEGAARRKCFYPGMPSGINF